MEFDKGKQFLFSLKDYNECFSIFSRIEQTKMLYVWGKI